MLREAENSPSACETGCPSCPDLSPQNVENPGESHWPLLHNQFTIKGWRTWVLESASSVAGHEADWPSYVPLHLFLWESSVGRCHSLPTLSKGRSPSVNPSQKRPHREPQGLPLNCFQVLSSWQSRLSITFSIQAELHCQMTFVSRLFSLPSLALGLYNIP